MKKFICLLTFIVLIIITSSFDWIISGNEAVAAAKQVLRGNEYSAARTSMAIWQTANSIAHIATGFFGFYTAYLFITDNKLSKNKKQ